MTVANKIEELIKKKIIELGLVKSGRMLNSINVVATTNGYTVNAVDYFQYLNKEYNIVAGAVNSPELKSFIETSIVNEVNSIGNPNLTSTL